MMIKNNPETILSKDYIVNKNYYRVIKWLTKRKIDFTISRSLSDESKTRSIYIPLFKVKGNVVWVLRLSDHEFKHFEETPYSINIDYSTKVNLKELKKEIIATADKANADRMKSDGRDLGSAGRKKLSKELTKTSRILKQQIGYDNLKYEKRKSEYVYGSLEDKVKILKGLIKE